MTAQLTPKEAEIAIEFIKRVDMKGAESIASATVITKLMAIRDGRELPENVSELEGKGKAFHD